MPLPCPGPPETPALPSFPVHTEASQLLLPGPQAWSPPPPLISPWERSGDGVRMGVGQSSEAGICREKPYFGSPLLLPASPLASLLLPPTLAPRVPFSENMAIHGLPWLMRGQDVPPFNSAKALPTPLIFWNHLRIWCSAEPWQNSVRVTD